jgi:hypothetical protein
MLVRSGIDTYTGYASLVAGWGDRTLIKKPPKLAIIGPAFNAFREYYIKTRGNFIPHCHISGTVCAELLRVAYLDL